MSVTEPTGDDISHPPACDTVALVLERDAGDRLLALWDRAHVWAIESPANREAATRIWGRPAHHEAGRSMTLFYAHATLPAEITEETLDGIEQHHDEVSQIDRYTRLEVHGAALTPALRDALARYEFFDLRETLAGFTASRAANTSRRA